MSSEKTVLMKAMKTYANLIAYALYDKSPLYLEEIEGTDGMAVGDAPVSFLVSIDFVEVRNDMLHLTSKGRDHIAKVLNNAKKEVA